MSYCRTKSLFIYQVDVEVAFLNNKIRSEVYVKQPRSFDDGNGRVLKLKKSLYELGENPRNFFSYFNKFITSLNFRRNDYGTCLYSSICDREETYIIVSVDDCLIYGSNVD